MIIIITRFFVPKGYRAMAFFPFVLVADKVSKKNVILLHHEKIHLAQQLEMLVLPFYIWYLIEFLYHFLMTRNKDKAYRKISFEQEAFDNEQQLNYLQKRRFWGFLGYLKKQK
jgi:hypothetical protein